MNRDEKTMVIERIKSSKLNYLPMPTNKDKNLQNIQIAEIPNYFSQNFPIKYVVRKKEDRSIQKIPLLKKLHELQLPTIVQIYYHQVIEEQIHKKVNVHVYMEYIQQNLSSPFKENINHHQALQWLIQCMKTISQLHKNGIYHCDVALRNVMIGKDKKGKYTNIKFIDFQESKLCKPQQEKSKQYLRKDADGLLDIVCFISESTKSTEKMCYSIQNIIEIIKIYLKNHQEDPINKCLHLIKKFLIEDAKDIILFIEKIIEKNIFKPNQGMFQILEIFMYLFMHIYQVHCFSNQNSFSQLCSNKYLKCLEKLLSKQNVFKQSQLNERYNSFKKNKNNIEKRLIQNDRNIYNIAIMFMKLIDKLLESINKLKTLKDQFNQNHSKDRKKTPDQRSYTYLNNLTQCIKLYFKKMEPFINQVNPYVQMEKYEQKQKD